MNGYSSDFFFQVRLTPGGPEVTGEPRGLRGHRIAREAGADGTPEGLFVEWEWDGRRLVVKNDRYGFFPVFYHSGGQQIAISNSVPALLAAGAPAALDDPAIAAFLRLGHFLGDDTPLARCLCDPAYAKEALWLGTFALYLGELERTQG